MSSQRAELPVAWVTGAGGLIGNYLMQSAGTGTCWRTIGLTRSDLDLTDTVALERRFREDSPSLVIHCAALSRSGDCALEPSLARKVNVEVTARLGELSSAARLVFLSSDLVFDGERGGYDESAPVNPLSIYGETKVEAEQSLRSHPDALIVRTSLNGGTSPTGDRGFNELLRREWRQGNPSTFFTDEFRCPIAAEEMARAIWDLARHAPPGIYHVAGAERLSRWDIGRLLADRWPQLQPKIRAGSLKDYRGPRRPADCSLNCGKSQKYLSAPLPLFSVWLRARPHLIF